VFPEPRLVYRVLAIAGILQRARASRQSDHDSFLFKFLPPWLRVLTREVDC
jgi:hypothetical protein